MNICKIKSNLYKESYNHNNGLMTVVINYNNYLALLNTDELSRLWHDMCRFCSFSCYRLVTICILALHYIYQSLSPNLENNEHVTVANITVHSSHKQKYLKCI